LRRSPKPGAVLGNDQQFTLAYLDQLFQDRDNVGGCRDLFVRHQHVRLVQNSLHAVGIADEIRADVPAINLHTLDVLGLKCQALALLDRDHAILADLVHHLGDQLADLLVLSRDGSYTGDLVLGGDVGGHLADRFDQLFSRCLDAALDEHRVRASGYVLQPLSDNGMRQDGCRSGAIAGDVIRLDRGFFEQLRAHVLVWLLELDLFRHGHAIVRDGRRTKLFVQRHVAALWPKRGCNGGCQNVDPALE